MDHAGSMQEPRARIVALVILALTVLQLALATFAPLERFEGKAFGARLVGYPLMMLVVPAVWLLVGRLRSRPQPMPWTAVAFVMAPFLVDVTGNSFDLYDRLTWWDDANHFANWLLLCTGVGLLLLRTRVQPRWVLGLTVAGLGALLAILWEAAEWYTFIRHGTELDTAYEDTLGDEMLGTLGGALAGVLVVQWAARTERRRSLTVG